MKFTVRRASIWNDGQPCEEATRDEDGSWIVEINTLEDLMEFAGNYGELIVSTDRIKIYDDYVE